MASRLRPLTAREIQKLDATAFVGGAPGLQLVVSPGGTKSWRLFYRLPGATQRRSITIGRYPDFPLANARQVASEMLAQAALGDDPKLKRSQKVQAIELTVNDALDRYLAWCKTNNATKTYSSKLSTFYVNVRPSLGKHPLTHLSRPKLNKLIDSVADKPATRRLLYLYLRHFLSWCVGYDYITNNPLEAAPAPRPVSSRQRVLSDSEIASLMRATGTMALIAKICLATAQRKGSVETMRWSDIDQQRRTWTIPGDDMKSGKIHTVPLSPLAFHLISNWPPMEGDYVFGVGTFGARPFSGTSRGMTALREQMGVHDWRLHDLRRTAVTLAQRAGCSLDAIRSLTQHKTSGVIGIYARHGFEDEKRAVADSIAREIENVTDLGSEHKDSALMHS